MNANKSWQRVAMTVGAMVLGMAVEAGLNRPAAATTETNINQNSINLNLIRSSTA